MMSSESLNLLGGAIILIGIFAAWLAVRSDLDKNDL